MSPPIKFDLYHISIRIRLFHWIRVKVRFSTGTQGKPVCVHTTGCVNSISTVSLGTYDHYLYATISTEVDQIACMHGDFFQGNWTGSCFVLGNCPRRLDWLVTSMNRLKKTWFGSNQLFGLGLFVRNISIAPLGERRGPQWTKI